MILPSNTLKGIDYVKALYHILSFICRHSCLSTVRLIPDCFIFIIEQNFKPSFHSSKIPLTPQQQPPPFITPLSYQIFHIPQHHRVNDWILEIFSKITWQDEEIQSSQTNPDQKTETAKYFDERLKGGNFTHETWLKFKEVHRRKIAME